MNLIFTLPERPLRAARLFTKNDETRYTLCGVLIEIPDASTVHLVATDGMRLFGIKVPVEVFGFQGPEKVILRNEHIDALRFDSDTGTFGLVVRISDESGKTLIRIQSPGQGNTFEVSMQAIDGQYPDWRKIIREENADSFKPASSTFNAEKMADFCKAASLLNEKRNSLFIRPWSREGDPTATIIPKVDWEDNEVVALIMPARPASEKGPSLPRWSTQPMPEPLPAKSGKPALRQRIADFLERLSKRLITKQS